MLSKEHSYRKILTECEETLLRMRTYSNIVMEIDNIRINDSKKTLQCYPSSILISTVAIHRCKRVIIRTPGN